jgi:hypothetical protein
MAFKIKVAGSFVEFHLKPDQGGQFDPVKGGPTSFYN